MVAWVFRPSGFDTKLIYSAGHVAAGDRL